MKKSIMILFLAISAIFLTACGNANENLIKNNIAEITNDYYFAQNDNFSVSISVGKREEPYILDGFVQSKVDFSLIIVKDKKEQLSKNVLPAKIEINGEEKDIEMQYNPISNVYMYDLGYKISSAPNILLNFENLQLEKLNFSFSGQQVITLACEQMQSVLPQYKQGGKLLGECYLKVLGEGENLFWCFTFLARDNKSFNIIISTQDGNIMASDF